MRVIRRRRTTLWTSLLTPSQGNQEHLTAFIILMLPVEALTQPLFSLTRVDQLREKSCELADFGLGERRWLDHIRLCTFTLVEGIDGGLNHS
jgi:hypothetical protein